MKRYEKYKDSGVDWIGEIPETWKIKKLKFLGKIYAGINGKKGDDFNKEYVAGFKTFVPFTNICNNTHIDLNQYHYVKIDESENQNRIKKNDILFLMSSETIEDIAKNSIYLGDDDELYLNSFCKGFRITDVNVHSQFINYLFLSRSYRNYFSLVGRGFTRINLKQEYINDVQSLLPPLLEQQAITEFLDDKTAKIDQTISLKQKEIKLLKERRQILIQKAVTKGLNDQVKMKDSGVDWIGEIPEHWEVRKLKAFSKAYGRIGFRGYTTSDLVEEGDGAITISPSNIKENNMIFAKNTFLAWYKYNESPEIKIRENDILIVKTGSTYGKIGIVKNLPQKATINPQLLVLKNIQIDNDYFYELLKTQAFKIQIEKNVIGSTIPTISETKILNFSVPVPSDTAEIKKIAKYIEEINAKIFRTIFIKEQEIEKLKEYKTVLIDNVVTGKVKVIA